MIKKRVLTGDKCDFCDNAIISYSVTPFAQKKTIPDFIELCHFERNAINR